MRYALVILIVAVVSTRAIAVAEKDTPCQPLERIVSKALISGAKISDIRGSDTVRFLRAAWDIAEKGEAPIADVVVIALYPNVAAIMPVLDGVVCSTAVVSERAFQRIMSQRGADQM
jgi:hypothetical protein